MRIEDSFDFKNPDYVAIYNTRAFRLHKIRNNPQLLQSLKVYYKAHPAQFISDWGATYDPRNPERGLPSAIPFVLFPKQIEWVDWVIQRWKNQEPGIVEKTRTVGMSWLSVAFACTMCLFNDGITIGFGSRKQEYVDLRGALKALLPKARMFLSLLPKEFLNGFNVDTDAPFMRINFKETGSQIIGESGDGIGRGDRASLYFVDEAAFLERPELTEASLSETTNCRIDISTPNGLGNPFEIKRHSGKIEVFTFHWRDDPRRNDEWYAKKCATLDPVTIAQELDIDYAASVEGVLIPSAWVQAAIDSHIKLGINKSGIRKCGLDVADEGGDLNALAGRHGIVLEYIDQWSGKGLDIQYTTVKAFDLCDNNTYRTIDYDADGLGAGVRGDARVLNSSRVGNNKISVNAFWGSGEVLEPDAMHVGDRTNKDYFKNRKAQAWWALRLRFQNTYQAVTTGVVLNEDNLISISSTIAHLDKLTSELSQPTYNFNETGKMLVNKKPDGTKSPNLADSIMIAFAPTPPQMITFTDHDIQQLEMGAY
jgi:hypothetical protein